MTNEPTDRNAHKRQAMPSVLLPATSIAESTAAAANTFRRGDGDADKARQFLNALEPEPVVDQVAPAAETKSDDKKKGS